MPVSEWPKVLDEFETLGMVRAEGLNIARFGDGELALMDGGSQVREPSNGALARELRRIMEKPHEKCLICIPTMDPNGTKYKNWLKRKDRFLRYVRSDYQYGSAFVSRPDSAQWIRTPEYARLLTSIWTSKRRVVLVSEYGVAIHRLFHRMMSEWLASEMNFTHLVCPHKETYKMINDIEASIVASRPNIAVLSCGPAATCLSHRLARRGIQAIDIGSAGKFLLCQLPPDDPKLTRRKLPGFSQR